MLSATLAANQPSELLYSKSTRRKTIVEDTRIRNVCYIIKLNKLWLG